jgi:MoaA/NifB/PqqE/SkfB family radical SAM enzyme
MNQIDSLSAPLLVSWQLTRDCDLACLHCCTESAPGRRLPNEMDRAASLRFAAEILRARVPYVMLCGGEPLIVPHVFELAAYLGDGGVALKIETNGQTLDEAMARRLAALPIRSIQISLDGDTEAVYRSQRPGGSLASAHAACRAVRAAGLPLEVTFAPTRFNIHEAEAVIERARSFGAFRFNTGALMPIGRAARLWQKIAPLAEDYVEFRQILAFQSQNIDHPMQICYEPFSIEQGLLQSLDAPPATLLVLPTGLVKIAGAIGYVCGDVRRITLTEIWENYRAAWHNETLRSAIRQGLSQEALRADADVCQPIPEGELEKCLT